MPKIRYFGAGTNRSEEMMEAIIGRRPYGENAVLHGYELCIQIWKEIGDDVRKRLDLWTSDDNFRSYFLRKAEGKTVAGVLWYITEAERKLVENWEFWHDHEKVFVKLDDGLCVEAYTDIINQSTAQSVNNGPDFLNDKQKMLEVAEMVRKDFLKS